MKRKLSPWCKEVKKTLIDRDMSVTELCGEVGMCRNYVTTTIKESLLDITADGIISEEEKPELKKIIQTLDEVNGITQNLKNWIERNLE